MIRNGLRLIYRTAVPKRVREHERIKRLIDALKVLLGHDFIYTKEFFDEFVEGPAAESAPIMADTIVAELRPASVVDVGCGTGALLEALRDRGCRVVGLEYATSALEYCQARGLDVQRFDIESDQQTHNTVYDVAVSMEVAEHLQQRLADRYVQLLTSLSSTVVITAAPPGQGGTDHVNEQPPEYWIEKFEVRGFRYDLEITSRWRDTWDAATSVKWFYARNLLVFRRCGDARQDFSTVILARASPQALCFDTDLAISRLSRLGARRRIISRWVFEQVFGAVCCRTRTPGSGWTYPTKKPRISQIQAFEELFVRESRDSRITRCPTLESEFTVDLLRTPSRLP